MNVWGKSKYPMLLPVMGATTEPENSPGTTLVLIVLKKLLTILLMLP